MAQIIPLIRDLELCGQESSGLDAARSDAAMSDPKCDDRTAEIIIFPGVRYERWADEDGCDPTGSGRGVPQTCATRDWLYL